MLIDYRPDARHPRVHSYQSITVISVSMFQSGGECIRAYVSVALDQLLQWRDDTGLYL